MSGVVFYTGPSLLTGDPVVGLLTGLDGESNNPKTGPLLQAYVLCPDQSPMDAVRDGSDAAICGDCALRGDGGFNRKCYVTPFFGPLQIWKQFRAGHYPTVTWRELQAVVEGRGVRLCAYGDPAALPYETWRRMLDAASTSVAYSHAWRHCDPRLKSFCMASVDTVDEAIVAGLSGWRTFRIRMPDAPLITGAEFICPASDEAGHKVTCAQCRLCRGTSSPARSVAIVAHGKPSSLKAFGIHVPMFGRRADLNSSDKAPVKITEPLLRSKAYRPREVQP